MIPTQPCNCGRTDGWHHAACAALSTAPVLDYRQAENNFVVYRRRS